MGLPILRPYPTARTQPGAPRVLAVARFITVLLTAVFVGLIGRTVQLQTAPPPRIAEMLGTQRSTVSLDANRGDLRDRQGRLVATTRVDHVLFIDTQLIDDPSTFADHVHHQLGYSPMAVDRALFGRENDRYVVLDPSMSEQKRRAFEAADIPGLATHTKLTRQYPLGPVAGQVVGFASPDRRSPDDPPRIFGKEGLELVFDDRLAGREGALSYYRTAGREAVWVERGDYAPPQFGRDVRLSIDAVIQRIAETQLAETCEQFDAKAGQVVAMDPQTGEIFAMANWPPFDPRNVSDSTAAQRRNRCVSDPFEPGSIFKPFVWAALIDTGLVTAHERIDCHGGAWSPFRGRTLHDAHGYGRLSWKGVLTKSSNIGMAVVAMRTDEAALHRMVTSFGFGETTGSRLPGESAGIVNPVGRWNQWSMTSVPMGQEIACTPLQLANAFCTIANGGLVVTPTIEAIDPADPLSQVQIYERVISEQTAGVTKQTLREVVTEGTGRRAGSEFYEIFGKTGTAQVADREAGGYRDGAWVSSFLCGAPLEKPRIVVGVFVHEPDPAKGYYGGIVAAPAARAIVEQSLRYLGVPTLKELQRGRIALQASR